MKVGLKTKDRNVILVSVFTNDTDLIYLTQRIYYLMASRSLSFDILFFTQQVVACSLCCITHTAQTSSDNQYTIKATLVYHPQQSLAFAGQLCKAFLCLCFLLHTA